MQGLIILSVTLAIFIMITSLPGLREWRSSIISRRHASFFVILPLATVFLGSAEAAQIGSLLSDPIRIARAIAIISLFLLSLFSIAQHIESWKLSGAGARWVSYFFLFCLISATWSSNPIISAWKGFEALTLSLSIISIAHTLQTKNDIRWLLNLISACLLFLALTVLVGLMLYPSEAIKNPESLNTTSYFAVRGLVPIMNPASVGSIAALLLISAFSSTLILKLFATARNNVGFWLVSGIAIAVMLLGHSRTPIFACMLAIIGILFFAKKTKQMLFVGIAGSLILIASTAIDFVLAYIYRGQTADSFASLTGRLNFWEGAVLDLISEAPFFGHGYYAGFREAFGVASLDNSYLAVTAGVGLAGLLIFIIPIIYILITLLKTRPRTKEINATDCYWLIIFGFTTTILIRSVTGTSIEVMHPLLVVYMVLQLGVTAIVRIKHTNYTDSHTRDNKDNDLSATIKSRVLKKSTPTVLYTTNKDNQ